MHLTLLLPIKYFLRETLAIRQSTNLCRARTAGAAGHPTSLTFGNGQYSLSASYDSGMRVTNLLYKNVSSGTTLLQEQPGYDAVNNVVTVSATLPQGTDNQQFCYDNLNRMTWSGSTGTPPCATFTAGTLTSAQYQESDSYNTEGQLTTGPAGGYTYGNSKHPHAVTATGNGYTASYELSGNMVCRALTSAITCNSTQTGQQLGYDAERRLSTWQDEPRFPNSTAQTYL
ncbi:hypothetical protein KSC_074390 [Ktedonobacter sp. SOSP1-52]|uniref:hypothetical protein n=1 Tax=Ktedonobacter sp. SOSP1-52 TaxID=2778366 RepID=UPI0019150CA8|nr:hypothetical protein [Ktedonobacter sp. SOSP1-52]GHO68547.1 hypothetical protein KSC_074390 [Ktedonobacter sp. SOSP1-52]